MEHKQLLIIGGGPAGLAAAIEAKKNGVDDLMILERDACLGGIMNQCIHNGFVLHTFNEVLTGPEYAKRYIDQVTEHSIPYRLNTMVLSIDDQKNVRFISEQGIEVIQAQAIILAMGCRERPRGALNIPGFRGAGIYSAGTAQKLVNLDGFLPGKDVVILGSGDIGLIMARRMTLEGAKVHAVAEIMPYSSGLKRNIVQCLEDYHIPLFLEHTIVKILGKDRVEGVVLAKVDQDRKPILGTEKEYACDTILFSCGLIPENELSAQAKLEMDPITKGAIVSDSLQTSVNGIFACGNVLHVHDLVDFVSQEASLAGKKAAEYVLGDLKKSQDFVSIEPKGKTRYVIPSKIDLKNGKEDVVVRFRVGSVIQDGAIQVYIDGKKIVRFPRRIMAPGEMETITLKREWLSSNPSSIWIESE